MIVILPTKYNKEDNLRIEFFKKSLNELYLYHIQVIIIDSSEYNIFTDIKNYISSYENCILIQQNDISYKKGGALREGMIFCLNNFKNNDIIIFQEPEKYDMIKYYSDIISHIKEKSYICIPSRKSLNSYPVEQQCTEKFINYYLNTILETNYDWSFGPVILTQNLSNYWLKYDGKMWNAQLIPIISCLKDKVKVIDSKINFTYPKKQAKYEEKNINFIKKRHYQLNYIIDSFEKYQNSLSL